MRIQANQIELEYEHFGDPADPALLLIMGLGGQLVLWPDTLCQALAAQGYYVIRYDNRDVGLSSRFEHAGRPQVIHSYLRAGLRLPVHSAYTLDDMADDALGLLDALRIARAHVVGMSMGGMIAQILAARQPQRVCSLALLMTTSGDPALPGPTLALRLRMVRRPRLRDREALIRYSMQTWRLIGSPGFPAPEPELRRKVEASFDRAFYPAGMARQLDAIVASGSRTRLLGAIRAPTLVLHGVADPLVPVAAAHDLARRIPQARLHLIPHMGHDLPTPLLPDIASLLATHARHGGHGAADLGNLKVP